MPESDYIIRYISLGKLIEMLDSCTLHLGRIDLFEDKTEGEWYANLAMAAGKAFYEWKAAHDNEDNDATPQNEDELIEKIRSLKQRSYISSWFSSDYLSIAMWKLYGLTDEGIAIRVRKDRLKNLHQINKEYLDSLNAEVLFSHVIYVDDNEEEVKKIIDKNAGHKGWFKFRNLLLKHKAYKFEEEYRMSVILPPTETEQPYGLRLSIGENLNDFIDTIYLNPLIHSKHWYIKVIKKVMSVFGIASEKLNLAEIRTSL